MRPPRRTLRRLATLWLTCLIIAAALQIPLAWACSLVSRAIPQRWWTAVQLLCPTDVDSDAETITINSYSFLGAHCVTVMAIPPTGMSRRYLEHHTSAPNSPEVLDAAAPWSPADLHPALASAAAWPARTGAYSRPNLVNQIPLATRHASGWPFPCVEGRIDYNNSTRTNILTGIVTDHRFCPTPGTELGYLCYHPRWPAYLANSLIDGTLLAATLLLLSLAFRSMIARRRIRHGLCPRCAYDLRATPTANPCPECGHQQS